MVCQNCNTVRYPADFQETLSLKGVQNVFVINQDALTPFKCQQENLKLIFPFRLLIKTHTNQMLYYVVYKGPTKTIPVSFVHK